MLPQSSQFQTSSNYLIQSAQLAVNAANAAGGIGGAPIELEVRDTGPGISPEIAGQLFQSFVTTKPHGMGVGLSISRTIVEAHGGQLEAEPNPGGGTIFRMTLKSIDDDLDKEVVEDGI